MLFDDGEHEGGDHDEPRDEVERVVEHRGEGGQVEAVLHEEENDRDDLEDRLGLAVPARGND